MSGPNSLKGHIGQRLSGVFRSLSIGIIICLPLLPVSSFARPVRVATYNIEFGTGPVGSDKYNAIRSTLARMDADIVCFQELWPDTFAAWSNMAASLGYSNTAIGANAPFSGGMYLGYASRFPILSTASAMSPPGAVELTRYPFRAVVAVPDAQRPLVLWTMHHKSSDANIDKFRRAVEARRAVQNIDAYVAANPDHNEYLFVGDMNEDIRDSQTAQYASQPSGAPDNYVLGADVSFPVLYSKFPTDRYADAGLGLVRMPAYWENSTTPITRIASGRQLDYVFLSPALMDSPLGAPVAETYYSANDLGGGLPKAGARLAAGTSAAASDHLPIFFDIEMADYSTVIPSATFSSIGEAGGPFAPTSKTYVIRETNTFSTSWSIAADVAWLSISETNPVVAPLVPRNIVVSFNAGATSLAPGTYEGSLTFRNLTTGIVEIRHVVLTIRDHLAVAPEEGFASAGLLGGPFTPSSKVYVVTNKSAVSRAFTAIASTNWLTVSPASGTIPARQAVPVTVSINANANPLLGKTYSASVVFSNQASGLVHGRPVTLAISGALCDAVDHCDRSWTTGGNSVWYYQTTNTSDGVDAARSGPVTNKQTSWLETSVTGPGQIAFSWKVSSRAAFHPLTFFDNGKQRALISGAVDWTRYTHELTSGVHTLRWTMDLSNITAAQSNSAGWLDQIAIDYFAITPTNVWTASGILDGPYSPPSKTYFLTNGGTATLQWSAAPAVPWITAEPPYGTLAPGSTSTVTLLLNESANALPLGSNVATVAFANQNSGITVSRRVVVVVSGDFCHAVDQCQVVWTNGGNSHWSYQTNDTHDGIDVARSGQIFSNQQSWAETTFRGPVYLSWHWKVNAPTGHYLRFTDNGTTRAQITGTPGWAAREFELGEGMHTARWAFVTGNFGVNYWSDAGWLDQVVLDYLAVLPTNGWSSTGYLGGPFLPESATYVVTNAGPIPLFWSAAAEADWFAIEPSSGELAPDSSVAVVCSLTAVADSLPYGRYSDRIVFSNVVSGSVRQRPVYLTVDDPLCAAIEACDAPWPGWTTGGNAPWFHQPFTAYDGVDAAQSGPVLPAASGQYSWMETTVAGPATVGFRWKVSSTTNAHALRFMLDGAAQSAISGVTPWIHRGQRVPEGTHTVQWVFNNNGQAAAGSNAAWLDQVALSRLLADPQDVWRLSAMPGGPFEPSARTYVLTNAGPDAIEWSASASTNWLTATPSGGTLEAGESLPVEVALTENAALLSPGLHAASMHFVDTNKMVPAICPVELGIFDHFLIDPAEPTNAATGFFGGPFSPVSFVYTVTNTSDLHMKCFAFSSASWLTVTPASRTVWAHQTTEFTATLNAAALRGAANQAQLVFSNETTRMVQSRWVTLALEDGFDVTTDMWSPSGPAGGPFSPATMVYVVSNRSPEPRNWTVRTPNNWLAIDPAGGTVPGSSAVQVVAATTTNALALGRNSYVAAILFSNQTSGITYPRSAVLAIDNVFCDAPDACDFDWTFGGRLPWFFQTNVTHDGIDAARSGPIADSQDSWMEISVEGPGIISFWWIPSSDGADRVQFLVDGAEHASRGAGGPFIEFQYYVENLVPGIHQLRWRYYKNGSNSWFDDCAWVDQIVWIPTTAMGVPIQWYRDHGLEPTQGESWNTIDLLPAASGDPNWIQYYAGLDPNDPDARFRIVEINRAAGQATFIHWRGGTNGPTAPYVVQSTTNLEIGPWATTGSAPRAEGLNIWTNPEPADVKRYYRILAPR